ncbi:adenylyltransferase/cytidyltransferase family protein [Candidatus Omnitrophota bacterium]
MLYLKKYYNSKIILCIIGLFFSGNLICAEPANKFGLRVPLLSKAKQESIIIGGGTFDLFHDGHKTYIDAIFKIPGKLVLIYVTGDTLANNRKDHKIQKLKKRIKQIKTYIKEKGFTAPYKIRKTLDIEKFKKEFAQDNLLIEHDLIVVTSSEYANIHGILNNIRTKNSLSPITFVLIDRKKDKNNQDINSSAMRKAI